MRRRLVPLVLALVGALLAAPVAAAHVEPGPRVLQRVEQDTVFSLEPDADLLMADREARLELSVVNFTTGDHPARATVRATLTSPAGAASALGVAPIGPGHWESAVRLDTEGTWLVEARVEETGAAARFALEVYPAAPWRFAWGAASDERFYAQETARAVLFLLDERGEPVADPPRGEARVTRVDPPGGASLTLPLEPTGAPGELALAHAFASEGRWRIEPAAPTLGLQPGDRPPFVVLVAPAATPIGPDEPAQTPGFAAPFALAALLLVALLRRRLGGA